MIDDAVGKILGMAFAYAVSALGLFLAYWNYRRRIVKADRVMTPTAWTVLAVVVLSVVGGVFAVASLTELPTEVVTAAPAVHEVEAAAEAVAVPPEGPGREASQWPLAGIVLPAVIFLLATWVTAALYRHFATTGH